MLGVILPMIPEHSVYVEPFFGGGAVFWGKQPAQVEFVNDINGEVSNFYRVLKTDYPALKAEIDQTLHSEHTHREACAIYHSPEGHTPVRRAWAVWVLSHQSFYAILGSTWKCSMTRNVAGQLQGRKEAFTEAYTRRLEHTSIFSRDALTVIRRADREYTFFYIDPPYYNADMGHYGGYTRPTSAGCWTCCPASRGGSCSRLILPSCSRNTPRRTAGTPSRWSSPAQPVAAVRWRCSP